MATPKNREKLSVNLKLLLTINEAAEYTGIGINKLSALAKEPNCTFVLYNGGKKLIKREAFEKYVANTKVI